MCVAKQIVSALLIDLFLVTGELCLFTNNLYRNRYCLIDIDINGIGINKLIGFGKISV